MVAQPAPTTKESGQSPADMAHSPIKPHPERIARKLSIGLIPNRLWGITVHNALQQHSKFSCYWTKRCYYCRGSSAYLAVSPLLSSSAHLATPSLWDPSAAICKHGPADAHASKWSGESPRHDVGECVWLQSMCFKIFNSGRALA